MSEGKGSRKNVQGESLRCAKGGVGRGETDNYLNSQSGRFPGACFLQRDECPSAVREEPTGDVEEESHSARERTDWTGRYGWLENVGW